MTSPTRGESSPTPLAEVLEVVEEKGTIVLPMFGDIDDWNESTAYGIVPAWTPLYFPCTFGSPCLSGSR